MNLVPIVLVAIGWGFYFSDQPMLAMIFFVASICTSVAVIFGGFRGN